MDQSAGYPYQGFNSKISVHVVRSLDGGATWSAPQQLSPGFATHMPTAAVGPDGELVVVWQDYATNQMLGRESLDFGATFGTEFIAGPVVDSRVVKPVGWQIGDFVAPTYSWIRQVPNPPALAIDRTTGPNRGRWYLSWTERPQGIIEPADSVVYEVEPNDDASRATPISVGQTAAGFACATHVCGSDCDTWVFDGVAGQTLFIDPVVTSGNVALSSTGLYCERTPGSFVPISGAPYRYSGSSTPQFVVTLPSTGRYAIYMCGSSFSIAYQIALHNVVLDASGPALDYRDIVLTSSIDHGASWGPRVRVNDDAPRFDNTFPALAVDDLGRLHAAWYDRRDDPTCGDEVRTYWTWSEDGGASFKPSLPLSRQPSDWGLVPNNGPVENRLALAATPMGIVAAWSQVVGADASDIFATVVTDLPTGIEVSGLAAELAGEAVRVRWTVGSVANVTGFEVERASGSGSFLPISGFVAARGEGHYEWLDSAPPAGAELRYRIAIHHESGLISYEGPVILERPAVVREFAWRSLGPNPFTRELQFAVATPHLGAGDVGVFDVAGHAVRSLHQGALAAGMNQFRWDGADAGGRPVPPGVYLLRARFEHTTLTRRVIRIE